MKRIGLAIALFVFAGTASAAIFAPPSISFAPPSKLISSSPPEAAIAPVAKATAPVTIESGRAPVPYVPHVKPPIPQLASLTEPSPPALPEIRPPQPPAATVPQPKPQLRHATVNEVRNLSEARCGGRTIRSIMVTGDGSVHVQC